MVVDVFMSLWSALPSCITALILAQRVRSPLTGESVYTHGLFPFLPPQTPATPHYLLFSCLRFHYITHKCSSTMWCELSWGGEEMSVHSRYGVNQWEQLGFLTGSWPTWGWLSHGDENLESSWITRESVCEKTCLVSWDGTAHPKCW